MKKVQVKVLKGTLGYQDGVLVIPKTSKDEAFPMEQDRAAQLSEQGIVQILGQEPAPVKKKKQEEVSADEEPPSFDAADAVQ